jgi:hypothetical protein
MKDLFNGLAFYSGNGEPNERLQFLVEFFRSIKNENAFSDKEIDNLYESIYKIMEPHKDVIDKIEHI